MAKTENEINIYFKHGKTRQLTLMHIVEKWSDKDFFYFKNSFGHVYIIPIKNILYIQDGSEAK